MTLPPASVPGRPPITFDDGAAYEQMMGRWSALVAAPFLDWLGLPDGLDWLDDGCGNGAFTEILVQRQRPSSVVGIDPSPAQLSYARERAGTAGARFLEGDALALPLPAGSVDAGVMALVLFFVPDPDSGVHELARVVRPGGTVAAYHWDLGGGGFPLQPVMDVVQAEGHATPEPPSAWASMMESSAGLWRSAGLAGVQTRQFTVGRRFDNFDEFWRSAHGSPRLRALFASLPPDALQRIRQRVMATLGCRDATQAMTLSATANAVKGRKPAGGAV